MQRFDVLVVGGGPAGSATAHNLASAGASVLLADKATFPRDKPCGGGLTARAFRRCPVDPTPVVEEEVDLVELRFRYGDRVERTARAPVIYMTQRRRLDAFLLDAARAKGVEVREGARVELGEQMRVDGSPIEVDVVVGADGANGTTARTLGLGAGIVHGVALEGNVPYTSFRGIATAGARWSSSPTSRAATDGSSRRAITSTSASVPGRRRGRGSGSTSPERVRPTGLRLESLEHLRGHRLPLRPPGITIASERALLVGDAAGLIDPVSGDGMYECFVSAALAAAAIDDLLAGRSASLVSYGAAIDAALGPLHRASWKLKRAHSTAGRG